MVAAVPGPDGAAIDAILAYASARSPYYRELLRGIDRFERIPPLSREAVRDNFDRITVAGLPPERSIEVRTSGSTATPGRYRFDAAAAAASSAARDWLRRLCGIPDAAQILLVLHEPPEDLPPGWGGLRMRDVTPAALPGRLAVAAGPAAYFLWGSASRLEWIAEEVEHGRTTMPGAGPVAAVSTSDMLTPIGRARLVAAFDCPVHCWYGSAGTDACLAGTPPGEEETYVVVPGRAHVEVAHPDGTPCDPGERGHILVTDLHNRCFPLIRYDLGDVAIASAATYAGRPTIAGLEGRASEVIRTPGGRQLSALAVHNAIRGAGAACDHLAGVQCVQTALDAVEVRFTWRADPVDAVFGPLLESFRSVLGADVQIAVTAVERLEVLPSGKRWVLRGLDGHAAA